MKRLGDIIIVLLILCGSSAQAERIVKVEALSTDTSTFRQNKIQLNMAELAAQLVPYQSGADVLSAGDADGQVIQGISGADAARVDIGVYDNQGARLIGSGATPSYVFADNSSAGLGSFDGVSDISVTDAAINMNSEGNVSMGSGDDNWLDLTPTYFEVGVGTTVVNLGDGTFNVDLDDGSAELAVTANEGFYFHGPRFRFATTAPSTSTDTCYAGMFAWDASYIYVCTADDTWKRSALSTW